MKVCPSCGLVFPDETTFCFVTGDTLKPMGDAVAGTTLLGRFRIQEKIADGPWASIYRAGYRLLEKKCVVKIYHEPLTDDQRVQFVQAILLSRRCTHPNITELVGGGMLEDGRAFVVHAHLEGAQPLSEVLARGQLPPARALGIAVQVLKALGRIHDFGGVHGSLRPSNVMVTPQGHAQVLEIGLGRSFLRDPWDDDPPSLSAQQYLAPELSSQRRASSKADLYAAGVIAAHMLSGRPPFDAHSVAELRSKLNDQGIDIDGRLAGLHDKLREWLKQIVGRGTEGRPANTHLALEELLTAAQEAGIKPEADPGVPAAPPVEHKAFARWEKFRAVFAKMVEMGFPAGATDQIKNALAAIATRVETLAGLGKKAAYEHGTLQDVLGRAREGRERVAGQMAEINDNAMEVRRELHPLLVAASRHGEKATLFPAQAMEQHRELVRWEGRSAFTEPYRELADAYKGMADIIEKWWAVRSAQLACEKDAAEKREELRTFEEQLDELRSALKIHESNLAAEIEACELALAALGEEADKLETELLDASSRFCAPLRAKPELGVLFHELSKIS
jgi:eukaryotic-like serine/threonine-protein kinase